jgi:hypothetical protein
MTVRRENDAPRRFLVRLTIDDHRLGGALADDAGVAPRLDCLGQHPFHALLADPPAPARERGGVDRRTVLEERNRPVSVLWRSSCVACYAAEAA